MTFLIVHGWQGNNPGHWQTWLAERLSDAGHEVVYPTFPDFNEPELAAWIVALERHLEGRDPDRLIVVCHSLGAVLWMHHAAGRQERSARRVWLVAPPSPRTDITEVAGFFPPPLDRDAIRNVAERTVLVCARDDPFCDEGADIAYAEPLGIEAIVLERGAHLNIEAGYGEWPDIERWVTEGWS